MISGGLHDHIHATWIGRARNAEIGVQALPAPVDQEDQAHHGEPILPCVGMNCAERRIEGLEDARHRRYGSIRRSRER
jgi:hypothetical protein